ncbi:hypothetical protein [Polyangium mundeleinium]|uniref:Lipoprotein n=1 Tax=Polyangium mundeleinium TaxID=2995306 RepID=A0ABT5EKS0_9BACT|nr:hypothetical protein [Polyangium mundeleinium]MDC0741952.1 hypothetical protein [Polyangium mundeleinium]
MFTQNQVVRALGWVTCGAIVASLALVACSKGDDVEARDGVSSVDPQELSAEELFSGIFFGVGPAAPLCPEGHSNAADEGDADEFVALLKAKEPAFLPQFRADVTSGDALRVDRAVGDAVDAATRLSSVVSPVAGADGVIVVDVDTLNKNQNSDSTKDTQKGDHKSFLSDRVFDRVLESRLYRSELVRELSRDLAVGGLVGR